MDWLECGNCWSSVPTLRNVSSLSIWGLGAHHLRGDALKSDSHSLHNQLRAFVKLRHENEHWVPLTQLGLHITDSDSRQDLFDFVNALVHEPTSYLKDNLKSLNISIESDNGGVMSIYPTARYTPPPCASGFNETLGRRAFDISIESDNGGVMSIYPTTRYTPPHPAFGYETGRRAFDISIESDNGGVMSIYPTTRPTTRPHPASGFYETLIRKTQQIYDVDYETGRRALSSLGQLSVSEIREKWEEFEEVHSEFTRVMFNHLWNRGILEILMNSQKLNKFEALHARGFEEHFMSMDILRLEVVKFAVYF